MIVFLPCFLIEFRRFFINQTFGFLSSFSHQLYEVFSPIKHTQFALWSLIGFKRFFFLSKKAIISNATCLSELMSKKKGNCNVIKLHNESHDRSNLIETISYYNLSQSGALINHPSPDLPNLLGQPFKSTFWINLHNQTSHWIGNATGL